MRCLVAVLALCLATTWAPPSRAAGGCDTWLRRTVRATGAYIRAEEPYARRFVFGLSLDCNGTRERVTVERGTGNLPICEAGGQVEVTGRLIWNKALVEGHYEINNPKSVVCR
jgi:hypothetical protein